MSADAWNIIFGGIAGAALTAAVAVFLYFGQRRDTNEQIVDAKNEALAAEKRSVERTMAAEERAEQRALAAEERTKKAGAEGEKRARLAAFHEECYSAKTWLEWLPQEREDLQDQVVRSIAGERWRTCHQAWDPARGYVWDEPELIEVVNGLDRAATAALMDVQGVDIVIPDPAELIDALRRFREVANAKLEMTL